MGMYDEVGVRCPRCKETNIIQTGMGPNTMACYTLDTIPPAVKKELVEDGTHWCEHCHEPYVFKPEVRVTIVARSVE